MSYVKLVDSFNRYSEVSEEVQQKFLGDECQVGIYVVREIFQFGKEFQYKLVGLDIFVHGFIISFYFYIMVLFIHYSKYNREKYDEKV